MCESVSLFNNCIFLLLSIRTCFSVVPGSNPDLQFSFMNHFSHYILTNYSINVLLCHRIIFSMSFLHFLPLFVKLLTFLFGFELTTTCRIICCLLTPTKLLLLLLLLSALHQFKASAPALSSYTTLYHCAMKDYGHVALFVYLFLNYLLNF